MKLARGIAMVTVAAFAAVGLAGCSSSAASSGTTINWWTWDDRQAASYQKCADQFHKQTGITVKISQYGVDDYFTKLTTGFVAMDAPDAFQDSVQYFPSYASQNQLEPLNDYITSSNYDLSQFAVGVDAWKGQDGEQYGLPLDWASTAFYYSESAIQQAGLTDHDIQTMTWNPDNGGTFDQIVQRLTIDDNGVRADQPGFDKNHVKTYGINTLGAKDFVGQTTWFNFAATTGWTLGNKAQFPTKLNYDDPVFIKTLDYLRSLSDRGLAPQYGQFTTSSAEQIGSGQVAMVSDGSWALSTYNNLKGTTIGVAPTPIGPDGTRKTLSNSNGNNIWSGSKHKDEAWKWISYMGTPQCQTLAGVDGTFLPSIKSAMESVAQKMSPTTDMSVFVAQMDDGDLVPQGAYNNGAELSQVISPMFEQFFMGQAGNGIFKTMAKKSHQILTKPL